MIAFIHLDLYLFGAIMFGIALGIVIGVFAAFGAGYDRGFEEGFEEAVDRTETGERWIKTYHEWDSPP